MSGSAERREQSGRGRGWVGMGSVRRVWETQVRLQQRYLERTAVGGVEGLRSARWLRWSGQRLVGDLLPPGR